MAGCYALFHRAYTIHQREDNVLHTDVLVAG